MSKNNTTSAILRCCALHIS